jgi:hypothetical protein
LRETIELLKQDLEKKEAIIQHHVVNLVEGRSTPAMDFDKQERAKKPGSVMSQLCRGRSNPLEAEMTQKMEAVLEDTLLKNIQLQVMKIVFFLVLYSSWCSETWAMKCLS